MLEARLNQAEILKKVLDSIKELVTDANFDCSDEGIKLQAMDNSHVALTSLSLHASGFEEGYRCDRNMSLGMSIPSFSKIIKAAGNDDTITIRADESTDVLGLLFESKSKDRIGEYEMKLMDIDQEHLGIPDTVYDAEVKLPSAEFARIIRDLKEVSESVRIDVGKEGVRFESSGDIGKASVTLKPTQRGDDDEEDEDSDAETEEEDEDEDAKEEAFSEDEDKPKVTKKPTKRIADSDDEDEDAAPAASAEDVKPDVEMATQDVKPKVKTTEGEDDDGDVVIDEEASSAVSPSRKRKASEKPVVKKEKKGKEPKAKKAKQEKKKPAPKSKKDGKADGKKGKSDGGKDVTISMQQAVSLNFSIKYLANFAKSTPLSDYVSIHMSNEVPLLVEYEFEQGHIRYYLAPKISDD